jgi:hypothetical protein
LPLNETGLTLLATTLQGVLLFGQLHSAPAGVTNMDNIALPGRLPALWNTPGSNFGLISAMNFTGGTPGASVYSVTFWDSETDGTCRGEEPLTGDVTFNAAGEFQVTAIDFVGTST